MKLRSHLYKAARLIGDVRALRSPRAFARRVVRKAVYRQVFKLLRRLGV